MAERSGYGPGVIRGVFQRWSRVKTYGLDDSVDMHGGGTKLAKVLNTFDLTLLGIGSTLGVGIYVLAGSVALDTAGPAVCISFLVAALASAFAAMCYAEFGARVPKAGSAYIYSYVTVGEFIAFVIGWNLILEYLIGAASVAKALSSNVDALFNKSMSAAFHDVFPIDAPGLSEYADFFAFGIVLVIAVLLGAGMKSSAIFTNIFTFVNIAVVVFVIIAGSINADPKNWSIPASEVPPGFGTGGFAPYGVGGIMAGAAKCFFAFVGFDSIAATGEEAKNAKRSIPISINLTLLVVFLAYFGVSTVITLMWPYYLQDPNTPLVYVFRQLGWDVSAWTISIGSLFGLAASLLGAMLPLPRVIYAQAKDGLVFRFLSYLSPRFQTPLIATVISALAAGVLSMIFDLDSLVDMMSIGTLLAYTLVAVSVLILRYEFIHPDDHTVEKDIPTKIRYPWEQYPSRVTSRNATLAIATYCALAIILCGVGVGMEQQMNEWVLFGLGLVLGVMLAIIVYLGLLPRSPRKLYFRVPLVPVVPGISVIINVYLMMKLSTDTWIRFAVWMAVGFLIYFAYGMWNSSEEYVKKGKLVPGASGADKGEDNEAFVEERPTSNNSLAVLVENETKSGASSESAETKTELHPIQGIDLLKLNEELSRQQQLVFDGIRDEKAREEQTTQERMKAFAEGLFQVHLKAQGSFDASRETKKKEEEANRQMMAMMAQSLSQLHEKAQKVLGESQPVAVKREVNDGKPPSPMNAVFAELKDRVTLAPEEADLAPEVLEAARTERQNASPPETPSSPVKSPVSREVLDELKEAFKQKVKQDE